jgi:CheY-like chemotaxis protein
MAQEKILLIDDDPSFVEITGAILRRFGYAVLMADNTGAGLEIIKTQKPDLLILDIMMATMDEGLRFATQLKQTDETGRLPIIIVSAQPETEKGYSHTVDEDLDWIAAELFMEKPIDPQALRYNIELLLKRKPSSHQA